MTSSCLHSKLDKILPTNPRRTDGTLKENFMFLLGDTLALGVLTLLISLFSSAHMKSENPVGYQAVNALRNSSRDFFIGSTVSAISGEKNPLALVAWSTKVSSDTWGAITGQNSPTAILKNVSIYRNINNIVASN